MTRIAMLSVHTSPIAAPGSPDAGGMNTYVRELSLELARQGLEVDIFTRRASPAEPDIVRLSDGVRLVAITAGPPSFLHKSLLFGLLPEFVRHVEEFRARENQRYDIVHSHYWLSGWVGAELARRWSVPHITMFHTTAIAKNSMYPDDEDSQERPDIELALLGSADAVVVASVHERALMSYIASDAEPRLEAIPCGVNLDLFRPHDRAQARAALALEGKQVVLFVGRLVPLKGVDILIEAMARLTEVPNRQLVVVGGQGAGDEDVTRLRWLADEFDLNGSIRFEPAVDQQRLPEYYSAADVCAIPSHYESFGLVATESLACGTPVVASKVGGLPTVVRDGHNGLLVPWRCPQDFADKIAAILTDQDYQEALRHEARPSVEHLSWSRVAGDIAALYHALLSAN